MSTDNKKQTLRLINSDCVAAMEAMPEGSIDAVICDPPYGISFMSSAWDRNEGCIAFSPDFWNAAYRVLTPGGIVKAFSGTRSYHRQAAAMYKAGFEELPMDSWAYGCLSDDSEIMVQTPDGQNCVGWKLGVDLVPGDCIRVWDPATLSFGWHVLSADEIRLYDYDSDVSGNMVVLSIEDYKLGHLPWQILTPNHRVYHMVKDVLTITEAKDLPVYQNGTACYIDVLRDEVYLTNGGTDRQMLTEECWRSPEGMPYKGKVWCVTVPTGAFVARRTIGTGVDGEYLTFVSHNSGFPKSLNVSKNLLKQMWRARESAALDGLVKLGFSTPAWAAPSVQPDPSNKQHTVTIDGAPVTVQQTPSGTFIKPDYIKPEMKQVPFSGNALMRHGGDNTRPWMEEALKNGFHEQIDYSTSVCPEADLWAGWGTAAKPAWEPILIGRKPVL